MIIAHGVDDFGEIALAALRHDSGIGLRVTRLYGWDGALESPQSLGGETAQDLLVQCRNPKIVETRRHGAEDRHFLGRRREGFTVALHLLAYVA